MGRVLNILKEDLLEFKDQIEDFSHIYLDNYNDRCKKNYNNSYLSPRRTKNFYDSVWGTIEINEGEILILDSPILQRLRHIKQLGLADLLFGSANHSRFSHTLGVLQTADSMARRVQRELQKEGIITDEGEIQIVRLAAIFHDCGHMFCSHSTERYFENDTRCSQNIAIEKIRSVFTKLHIKPSTTEIISVLMVNSPSVRNLLSIVDDGLFNLDYNNGKSDIVIEKICCLILGFPYSEKTIPYSQIISGQIDADKLDYLKRDSHSTGVPVAVDMSRIFQKIRVVNTNDKFQMLSTNEEKCDRVFKLAIAPAAINTVDQLIISRYMMFENVYFHQKTLTSEELLRYALRLIDSSTKGLFDNFINIMKLTDGLVMSNQFVEFVKTSEIEIRDKDTFEHAAKILSELSYRNLFKRCVAFTSENLTDIGQMDSRFYTKMFIDRDMNFQECFIDQVICVTQELKSRLKGKLYFNDHTDILLIKSPSISYASLNSNLAIAFRNNKNRDDVFEADNWLKSRLTRKPQNFLVSYPEDRYLVFIATELVLLNNYGLLLNDSIIYSSEDEEQINKIKMQIKATGLFGKNYILIPSNEIDLYDRKIGQLVKKWSSYERFDVETGNSYKLDKTFLVMFLKQFYRFEDDIGSFDIFLNGCLTLLESMTIVSKECIIKALKENIKKIIDLAECNKVHLCNIGNTQDSSSIILYHINEVNKCLKTKFKVEKLEDVIEQCNKDDKIIFIDDAFFSGTQLISIFETYLNVGLEKRKTKEIHVKPLSAKLGNKLKKSDLNFAFIYENSKIKADILKSFSDLGLEHVNIISWNAFPEEYFKNLDEEKRVVKEYFTCAGKMLINKKSHDEMGNRKDNWSDERIENSYLGYNNAQQLVAFSWNTPTYTLTPLWMQSTDKDAPWYPLFPRIDKE